MRQSTRARSRAVAWPDQRCTLWLLLAAASMLVLLLPRGVGAEEPGEDRTAIGQFDLLAPVKDSLSGSAWLAAEGMDPRFATVGNGRGPGGTSAGFAEDLAAPGPQAGVARSAAQPLVPFRNPGPAFSRNQIITRQLGLFPIQTEPHIAVDPTDPQHLVMGTIDYNFPSMSTYTSFDGGETWDGPNQVPYFQEDVTAAGDPVLAFSSDGKRVYMTSISLGFEEFVLGSLVSYTEVSSMVVSMSADGGLSWSDAISAARSDVVTTSNVDPEGKERGEIKSAFLDKPWIAVGPDPEDPTKDIVHLSYTEFATTYRVLYADELPFLTAPYTETTIRTVRSVDDGMTWSEPIGVSPTVLQAEGAGEEGEEEGRGLAVNDDGEPIPAEAGTQADGGLTMQELQEEGQLGEESNRTVQGSQPKVFANGTVVVAYVDTTNDGVQEGLATIMVTISEDGGQSFGEPIQAGVFREPHFNSRSASFRYWGTVFPQLAVGQNQEIYILTTALPPDKPTDDGDVYLMRSMDAGKTWAEPQRLNGDDTDRLQFFTSIAVAPNGTVHAMWGDMRDDPDEVRYHIYYSESTDQGKTWGFTIPGQDLTVADTRVTDFASNSLRGFPGGRFIGDYFSLAASDEDVYMVWADTRLGEFGGANQQIGFARKTAIAAPSIVMNPPTGTAGREVTLQGYGFQADSNVAITVGDAAISTQRTNNKGEFTATLYMPLTGEGAQNVSAFDDTGNAASASFYTEFGFDSVRRSQEALADQIAALQPGVGAPAVSTPGTALPSPPAGLTPVSSPTTRSSSLLGGATPAAGATPTATPDDTGSVGSTAGGVASDRSTRLPDGELGALALGLALVGTGAWSWRRRRAA